MIFQAWVAVVETEASGVSRSEYGEVEVEVVEAHRRHRRGTRTDAKETPTQRGRLWMHKTAARMHRDGARGTLASPGRWSRRRAICSIPTTQSEFTPAAHGSGTASRTFWDHSRISHSRASDAGWNRTLPPAAAQVGARVSPAVLLHRVLGSRARSESRGQGAGCAARPRTRGGSDGRVSRGSPFQVASQGTCAAIGKGGDELGGTIAGLRIHDKQSDESESGTRRVVAKRGRAA